jgi:hypothetical protein
VPIPRDRDNIVQTVDLELVVKPRRAIAVPSGPRSRGRAGLFPADPRGLEAPTPGAATHPPPTAPAAGIRSRPAIIRSRDTAEPENGAARQEPTSGRGGSRMSNDFEYISRAALEYRHGYRHAYVGEVPEPVVYGMQGALRQY